MKDIETQGSNLFSRNIVELKLISDRIAEGKGEKAGIFSNTYQILYILDRKEKVTPKELIAELNSIPQNRNAQVTQTAIQEQTSAKIATETQKCVQQEIANAPVPVAASQPVVKKCVTTKTYRRNTAHNWWLALIAFLLFLHLIFKN
jgi:hypothetical protein